MHRTIPDAAGQVSQLCGHIRRTLKIEVYLIGLTLLALWVMYSVAEIGRQRLAIIDSASAASRLAYYATIKGYAPRPSDVTSDIAWAADESEASFERVLVAVGAGDDRFLKAFQPQIARLKEIESYDRQRRDAFNVALSPPYVKDTFTINAIDLANACPFVVMTALTFLLALRFRQRAYELALASTLLGSGANPSEQARFQALAEFRVGTLRMCKGLGGEVWVYRKPFTAFVETPAMLAVVALIAWYSSKLLSLPGAAMEATHSMFLSFYGYMSTAVVVAVAILRKTRSYYADFTSSILGAPVTGFLSHEVASFLASRLAMPPWFKRNLRRIGGGLVVFLGTISLLCLPFPWMTRSPLGGEIRGLELLRFHPPLSGAALALKGVPRIYSLDPQVFNELRAVLVVSILFLAFCIAAGRAWARRKERTLYLQRAHRILSYAVLVLAGYLLCYLLGLNFLQSNSNVAQANALTAMTFEGAHTRVAGGLPLLAYNPCPAFWVYFASCVLLATVEVTTGRTRRRPTTTAHAH